MRGGMQKPGSCRNRLHSEAAAIFRVKITSSGQQLYEKRRNKSNCGESCSPFYYLHSFVRTHRTPPSGTPKTKTLRTRMVAEPPSSRGRREEFPEPCSSYWLGESACLVGLKSRTSGGVRRKIGGKPPGKLVEVEHCAPQVQPHDFLRPIRIPLTHRFENTTVILDQLVELAGLNR